MPLKTIFRPSPAFVPSCECRVLSCCFECLAAFYCKLDWWLLLSWVLSVHLHSLAHVGSLFDLQEYQRFSKFSCYSLVP